MKTGCEKKVPAGKARKALPVLPSGTGTKEHAKPSSGVGKWRAAALIGLHVLMIAHIVQWKLMDTTISPIEPSETMYTLQSGAVNAGFIFFSAAILATLIFGRFVCGWACHVVALQDLCAWILKKIGLTPRPFRSRVLVFVPLIVALYMFVWPTVSRFIAKRPDDPLFPYFTNHIVTTDFWATFPPVWIAIPFLFVCGFMVVYFLGSKGFCTYACPYGGFFGVADRVAPGRIRVTDACNECGHCTAVCTSNVTVHAEVKEFGMVTDPGCMKCMDCVSACPNDALYFGFGRPSLFVKGEVKKRDQLNWAEEAAAAVVFFVSFMAFWDLYQVVPMLMALGLAAITTFLFIKTLSVLTSANSAFYGYSLRSSSKFTAAGAVFLTFAISWLGMSVHSGWIRYNETAGTAVFERLRIPDELALSTSDASQWLNASDRENISKGTRSFSIASKYGLLTNVDALPKQAWLEYLAGNIQGSLDLLERASKLQTGQAKALSHYYRGAILNRSGGHKEAIKDLDAAISLRPDLTASLEEKGESLWRTGDKAAAVAEWTKAVKLSPELPLANNFLAAAMVSDDENAAAEFVKQADRVTPPDPYFHWMLGQRLRNLGMADLAEKHFNAAVKLNPAFQLRRDFSPGNRPADIIP